MSEVRTPPSLKWLLDKRARLLGEIQRHQKAGVKAHEQLAAEIDRTRRHLADLEARHAKRSQEERLVEILQGDLAAVDQTLRLHHIQIDPDLIAPIRSHTSERYLAHGVMTRLIYAKLKDVYPAAVTATETALFIASEAHIELDDIQFKHFRDRVARRLKNMAYESKIVLIHNKKQTLEGRWRLNLSPSTTTSPPVD